ncbi:MAG: hypothetical protein K5662_00325 [Lachnospiraceae bacterium]|jgi:hypothetical protein|nr:hypothetical protein [Lachnospiraceae bacterium]
MNDRFNDLSVPPSFPYKKVYEKGKPAHEKGDSFSIRHPSMDHGKRAKIFSPFDALKGFSDELKKTGLEVTESFREDTEEITEYP